MFILVVIGLIVITPVQITLHYRRAGEEDHLLVELSAWFRLIRRTYEIPAMNVERAGRMPELVAKMRTFQQGKVKKESVNDITGRQVKKWSDLYQELLKRVHDLRPLAKALCKRVRCTRLEWHTQMGTGHADETGALTGIVWGVKSVIVGTFSHMVTLRAIPRLSVQPVWNESVLHTEVNVHLRIYLGHLLHSGLKLLFRMRRGKWLPKWQTTPSQA